MCAGEKKESGMRVEFSRRSGAASGGEIEGVWAICGVCLVCYFVVVNI